MDLKAGIDNEGNIEFIFYRKPVANNLVTLKSAAASLQQKMATLTQQCFMRLHNTSENASEITKLTLLNEFMKDLWLSGYSELDRLNILKGATNTYRSNSFQKLERKQNKANKKNKIMAGQNRSRKVEVEDVSR